MTETPTIRAYMWWCGDDVCDCTQPRIERLTKRPFPSVAYDIERLWEGQFMSEAWSYPRTELAERLNDFRKAAHRFAVPLTRDRPFTSWSGRRADTGEHQEGDVGS